MDRAEATGFGVAVVGHVALLAAIALGLFHATVPPQPQDAIEVSFAEDVALTSSSPTPMAQPPAPSDAPELGAPEEAAPAPAPVPTPTPQPTPREAAPSPARERAPPQPQTREPQKANPRTTRETRDRRRPEEARNGRGERNRGTRLADLNLDGLGRDPSPSRSSSAPAATFGAQERASVRQAIARALAPCQRQPLPAPEAAAIRVEYRVTLNRDGSLANAEFVRVINSDPGLAQYERRMRDLALNVLTSCTPIRGLPPQFYDVAGGWRQFPYRFDPRTAR